jgi:uncharacterized protein YeaO (DUF488 family)
LTRYLINIKRVYDKRITTKDYFILVDRLWPRGIRKQDSNIDLWIKDIAPSNSLRKWFNHEPSKWNEFESRYYKELDSIDRSSILEILDKIKEVKSITLVYAAKDEKYNNAVALRSYLLKKLQTN